MTASGVKPYDQDYEKLHLTVGSLFSSKDFEAIDSLPSRAMLQQRRWEGVRSVMCPTSSCILHSEEAALIMQRDLSVPGDYVWPLWGHAVVWSAVPLSCRRLRPCQVGLEMAPFERLRIRPQGVWAV